MSNNWLSIWNNRKANFENLNTADEQQLILELKKIVGYDFHGKGENLAFDELKKEYEYLKNSLKIDTQNGGGGIQFLKLVAVMVLICTFSKKTDLKLAA